MLPVPKSGAERRKKTFKVGVHSCKARERRNNNLIKFRKDKKEDNMLRKRIQGAQLHQQLQSFSLPAMVKAVWTEDPSLQLTATTQFSKLPSIQGSHLIEQVINAGLVPRFVQFLTNNNFPQLQCEAARALVYITSGTSQHSRVVVDHGAVPHFIQLLAHSPNADVREQAVSALGNIAADSADFRDLVLRYGALMPLLAQLNQHSTLSTLKTATWALSNFLNGNPNMPLEHTKLALEALYSLIQLNNEEVLTDACWTLSYLTLGGKEKIQPVIEAGVCPRLVELLQHPSPTVVVAALRTVGNIVAGDEQQTQFMIDNGVLPWVLQLLTSKDQKKVIKKEACWTISNIMAGNGDQIQAVIDANIVPPVIQLLQSGNYYIMKEAAWAICNTTSQASPEQIKYLVKEGCIHTLCDLLDSPMPKIVRRCLEGLENFLQVVKEEMKRGNAPFMNLYAKYVYDSEGLERIKDLRNHENSEIFEKAVQILQNISPRMT